MPALLRVVLLASLCCLAQQSRGDNPSDITHSSLFSVGVDAIWLSHGGGDFRSEILDPSSGTVSSVQDLAAGLTVAPRFRVSSRLFDEVRTEFIYLQSDDWDSRADIAGTEATPELDASIQYTADLQNFELNFIGAPSVIDTQWLLGLRYLRYRDSFIESYQLESAIGPTIDESAVGFAENEAMGPQAGIGLNIDIGQTTLSLGSKFGLLNNTTHQTGPSYLDALVIDGTPESSFENESDELMWLADIEVSIVRSITSRASLRIGYQGLFLDRIVQSAAQNGGQAEAENLWFNGLVLGGQWIW